MVENNQKITVLNIQPQADVLGVFSRLNYKPWYAIAEFVDNSTQSFYSNEERLAEVNIKELTVEIIYDFDKDTLIIRDNAYGMEIDDFQRAVKLDSKPAFQGGRNEFGMGLKTAASWFGNWWSVESTQYGSDKKYYTIVDINELKEKHANTIDIISVDCPREEHGTTITINQITKRIDAARTKSKIIKLLESMYRRDLNSDKITITFNGCPLQFTEYQCLTYKEKTWKKDVSFSFEYNNRIYNVHGFVGILADGGYGKAGFALFRRNRVVIGGEEQNYKPDRIFIQAQSTIAHKLFGEFDMDDFDINQAKDGFVWDNGLEDEFVDHLRRNIKEYIDIAKLTKKERAQEEQFSVAHSMSVQEQVQTILAQIDFDDQHVSPIIDDESSCTNDNISNDNSDDLNEYLEKLKCEELNSENKLVGGKRNYTVKINDIESKSISIEWDIGNKEYWINVKENDGIIEITININHPFFKPYSNEEEFKIVLEKFVIAFVVAEQQAKATANEGYIAANAIRTKMNQFLAKLK